MENLDNDCKIMKAAPTRGGLQEQWFLTEDGVYELLFISRKKIAKEFKKWVRNIIIVILWFDFNIF
jgi:prophage antirepressor-like protein